jgi:hypothetical protein
MRWFFPKGSCWLGGALCSFVLAAIVGCDHSANVSGRITYQGRPVTYGSVVFRCSDDSARSAAIKPDGTYAVENVSQGNASIAVISRNPALGRSAWRPLKAASVGKQAATQDSAVKSWFPLPSTYEDPRTSGLSCEISTRRVAHDVELQ